MGNILYVMAEDSDLQSCMNKLAQETDRQAGNQPYRLVGTQIFQIMRQPVGLLQSGVRPQVIASFVALSTFQLDKSDALLKAFEPLMPMLKKILKDAGAEVEMPTLNDLVPVVNDCIHKWDWQHLEEDAVEGIHAEKLSHYRCSRCGLGCSVVSEDALPIRGFMVERKNPGNSVE